MNFKKMMMTMKLIIHPRRREDQRVHRRNLWLRVEKHRKRVKRLMMMYKNLRNHLKSSLIQPDERKDAVEIAILFVFNFHPWGYTCAKVFPISQWTRLCWKFLRTNLILEHCLLRILFYLQNIGSGKRCVYFILFQSLTFHSC